MEDVLLNYKEKWVEKCYPMSLVLQTQVLSAKQANEPCIGLT